MSGAKTICTQEDAVWATPRLSISMKRSQARQDWMTDSGIVCSMNPRRQALATRHQIPTHKACPWKKR